MQRRYVNLLLETAGLLLFAVLVSTGLLLKFVLPPGSGRWEVAGGGSQGGVLTLLGLSRHEWGEVHFWISAGFLAMLIVHLGLHWRWVWGVLSGAGQAPRSKAGPVMAALIVAVFALLVAFPFFFSTRRMARPGETGARVPAAQPTTPAHEQDTSVRGSMTLREAAGQSGVEVEKLRRALKLPADVSPEERLGRLGRSYGFSMREVRAALGTLRSEPTTSTPTAR